jgi:hypothetical protein
MLKKFTGEVFKDLHIHPHLRRRYAISNYGRLVSYTESIDDGKVLKGSNTEGFRTFGYKVPKKGGKKYSYHHIMLHRKVAELFLPKESEDQTYVLHLDHRKDNDHVSNLKWATRAEQLEHWKKSPNVIAARYAPREIKGRKLTSTDVIRLKKRIFDPNRKTRMKLLAKEFNISEMQLFRIKRGENWGHIKV